ncbi:MAG: FAD-binding protein, partial [Halobacteriaceae archaeon]
ENILHLAEDFEGVDALEEPMPVKPGQHYEMGGLEVNEHGETCIEGLYAAGECACVSVHGANRLGGNALPELIVFGKRAGQHAAGRDLGDPEITVGRSDDYEPGSVDTDVELGSVDGEETAAADGGERADPEAVVEATVEAERERVERLLEREDGVHHAHVRSQLQETMTENVNVFRTEDQLRRALADIREAREEYEGVYVEDPSRTFNTDVVHTLETRNLLDLAEALTLGALVRDEFRGAHWREGYQFRDDENWLKHTLVSWNGGDPELGFKPVVLEGESKTYEPKERSY